MVAIKFALESGEVLKSSKTAGERPRFVHAVPSDGVPANDVEVVELIGGLRADRPEDDFVISYRTGWDPQGMDPGLIAEEASAYAEAGVQHVVSAPWRESADDWIRSMEMLVEIVAPEA